MSVDIGISKGGKEGNTDDYEVKYLSQLEAGDTIEGEIHITDIKEGEIKGKPINQFYLILTDHKNEKKWVCGMITSVYDNSGVIKIYGEKGGRIYTLIDTINNALNGTGVDQIESYSVVYETFQDTVNTKLDTVFAKAVQPSNTGAKSMNIAIEEATLLPE